MPTDQRIMYRCFICRNQFQMGPQIYEGKYIKTYDISVCNVCYDSNWDGWAPQSEEVLIKHLSDNALPIPERNEKGLLPRG